MSDALYRGVRLLGAPFRYRVSGLQHVAAEGPALFVGNHAGSQGPIAAVLSLPLRLYPWVAAATLDPARAPQRIYDEVVERELHLHGRLGRALAACFASAGGALMRGLGVIPVERSHGLFDGGLRRSLTLLEQGRRLLVFPEDPDVPSDPATGLHPFLPGCVWVWRQYEARTGQTLPVHPFAVHGGRRAIALGPALAFERAGRRAEDVRRMAQRLQDAVAALYRGLEAR